MDMDFHKGMLALHLRANPREVLVGWYATSATLNTFSALIQNFYGQQGDGTWPHPAVHLTVATEPGKDVQIASYISAPIGVTAERAAESCVFIPVPHEIKYGESEKSGLELIAGAKDTSDGMQEVVTDIGALERSVENVLELLDRVSNYVNNVLDEEAEPSSALGQFLMNALSLAPKVNPADIERDLYVLRLLSLQLHHRLTLNQQQPHPGRPRYFIPCQHHPHTNRPIKSARNSRTHAWRRRWFSRRRREEGKARSTRRKR